jgi:hypothetical protein
VAVRLGGVSGPTRVRSVNTGQRMRSRPGEHPRVVVEIAASSVVSFLNLNPPLVPEVVQGVPVVLEGKMGRQGGTERGTGWYRYRVIACRSTLYHPPVLEEDSP